MLIAAAKSRSARGASHQPPFMGSCLTISHTCYPAHLVDKLVLVLYTFMIGYDWTHIWF